MPFKTRKQRLEYNRNYQPFYYAKLSGLKKKRRLRQIKVSQRMRGREYKVILVKEMGGACTKCGIPEINVLSFHHIDRKSKKQAIGTMLSQGASLENVRKEAMKCVLLCAKCHMQHHILENRGGIEQDAKDFGSRARKKG